MSDDLEQQETGDVDLARRRALHRALGVAPVILTLSSTPDWASHYGYPPGGCNPVCGCKPDKKDFPDNPAGEAAFEAARAVWIQCVIDNP